MKTIIIFIFIFAAWIIGTLSTFNLKCPQYVQRYIRSQQVCPNHPLYYSCLCNTENTTCSTGNEEIIHEYCNDKPEFAGIGQKYVWSGGLRNIECSSERFQPPGFNLWQNVSSQCIYLKSFCNEEGQVIHINGSAEKDVSCRCDHTKGYDFVTNITDKSSCKPLEKDCSCYVKKCLSNENLSKDYSCIASNNKNTVSQDQQIPSSTRQPIVEPQDLMFNITGLQRYNHEYRTHLKFGLTVLICLFLIIGCYLMIVCLLGDLLAKFTDTSTDPKTASSDPRERDNSTQNIPFLQNSDHSTDTGVIGKHTVLIHDTEPSDNLSNCNANAIPTHNEKRTESTSTKDALEKSFSDKTIFVVVSPVELNEFVGASCQFNATIWSTNSEIKKIEWLHFVTPDKSIPCDLANTEKYDTEDQQSLTILSLEPADTGTYVCRASNSEETIDSEHIKLNVKEYTPKISNSIGKRTIDNELKTTLEFELDVPEPDEIFLLFKKNDSEIFVPGEVDKNQHIFTCYFPICCSGKYELVVKTHFGVVHRQTIDLKIPSVGKQHLKKMWSFDNLRLNSQKDAKISTENTAQNIDSTKNVDESQESTTDEKPETTTEDIDSTEDFAESYQLTTDIQPESKELNNDFYTSLKKTNVRAVIALDVGTTHSRYAVLITETLSCKEKWEPVIEDSVPTAVLFKDSSKNYIACGDEAMPEYICAIENGERESYLMFEKFKLELYKRMEITAEMKIKDGYGRPMLAIDVYTAVINDLKQRALIHTERKKIEEIHIAWVMTVPDVWNKNAKDFIQLTCESSGIPKEQLIIEDESIAILKYFQDVQYFCKEKIISQNLDDKNYLLIDLGGGTCDITGYHVTADCDVGVPIKPTHIACGVDIACNAILERISSMIGDRAMDCMKEEETSSFLQLKEACLQLCKTSEYTLKLNVPIHIFDKLCTRFRLMSFEETVDDFGKTLSCGNSKHIDIDFKLSGDKLIVRKGLIDDSLKVVIGTVISEIMHILKTQKAQDIQQFFIVGGFSSLLIVQNEIQEAFKEKSVLFANDKVYSSVKGAFLCRCNKIRME
ncbi:uncharacterized protein LOC127716130 isoform X4 [Mytilus californianus]|uniref:uncharacterized protein LOC127716130 isoform X4 n=1 Tax=Mytilus californianus TaxID=6549 RepID=UPI0022470627|nr:uncharacterized protein LOC127716130 isoform X4 [Mytilus californianus]